MTPKTHTFKCQCGSETYVGSSGQCSRCGSENHPVWVRSLFSAEMVGSLLLGTNQVMLFFPGIQITKDALDSFLESAKESDSFERKTLINMADLWHDHAVKAMKEKARG